MGRGIIKIKDKYFEWSTIVDAPITYGITLDELKIYIREEYGEEGIRILPERLKRVEEKGTSFVYDKNIDETIFCNRAGNNESEITKNEIYKKYNFREQK